MRKLFLVLAKLLGLLQFFWAFMSILKIGSSAIPYYGVARTVLYSHAFFGITGSLIYFVFQLGLAWVFLFHAEWLADKLKIVDDAGEDRAFDCRSVLPICVKVIGVYVTVYAIPCLAKTVIDINTAWIDSFPLQERGPLVSVLLQLVLGLLLTFRTAQIVSIITCHEHS